MKPGDLVRLRLEEGHSSCIDTFVVNDYYGVFTLHSDMIGIYIKPVYGRETPKGVFLFNEKMLYVDLNILENVNTNETR